MEFFEDHRLELYNLRDDIGETKNLAKVLPEKAKDLHAKMIHWRESIHAPMPTLNPAIKSGDNDRPRKRDNK